MCIAAIQIEPGNFRRGLLDSVVYDGALASRSRHRPEVVDMICSRIQRHSVKGVGTVAGRGGHPNPANALSAKAKFLTVNS